MTAKNYEKIQKSLSALSNDDLHDLVSEEIRSRDMNRDFAVHMLCTLDQTSSQQSDNDLAITIAEALEVHVLAREADAKHKVTPTSKKAIASRLLKLIAEAWEMEDYADGYEKSQGK